MHDKLIWIRKYLWDVIESLYHWELNPHAPKLNDILFGNIMVQINGKYLLNISSKTIDLI